MLCTHTYTTTFPSQSQCSDLQPFTASSVPIHCVQTHPAIPESPYRRSKFCYLPIVFHADTPHPSTVSVVPSTVSTITSLAAPIVFQGKSPYANRISSSVIAASHHTTAFYSHRLSTILLHQTHFLRSRRQYQKTRLQSVVVIAKIFLSRGI